MTDYPLVIVSWVDAYSSLEEQAIEELQAPKPEDYLIHTSGFLVGEDEGFVYIAHEQLERGEVRGTTVIPAPLILSKVVLAPVEAFKAVKAKQGRRSGSRGS